MKKFFIYFCLSLFYNIYAQEEIVYIPDEKLKNWLLNQDEINTNGDDEIQVSEAISYTGHIGIGNSSPNDELLMDTTRFRSFHKHNIY